MSPYERFRDGLEGGLELALSFVVALVAYRLGREAGSTEGSAGSHALLLYALGTVLVVSIALWWVAPSVLGFFLPIGTAGLVMGWSEGVRRKQLADMQRDRDDRPPA